MFTRLKQLGLDRRLKAFYEKYQRVLVPGLLLFGFVVDVITFKSLQIRSMFILLGIHASIAGVAIIYSHIYDGRENVPKGAVFSYLRFAAPLVLQFTFGALLSASLLFYWFSGALSVSWPIMILLAFLMASNEVFRHYYLRPSVQIGVYAFVLFSYFSLLFPFVFRSLDPSTFVLSGLVSTAIVLLVIFLIVHFSHGLRTERTRMIIVTVAIFSVFNALYFLNVIPPIPLSIRDAGVYHNVQRQGSDYLFVGEEETFLQTLWPGQTIHSDPDGRIYAFTAIFAPTDLATTIYHRWQFYDEAEQKWITSDRLSYMIRGGRDEGYRGYTFKSNLAEGKWRVIVETERGQVLGRIPFTLEK